jgi:hypothetical protein
MARKVVLVAVAALIAGTAQAATPARTTTASQPTVTVKPHTGAPTAGFTVRFTTPDQTGRAGSLERRDVISAHGPANRHGCVNDASINAPAARANARLHVTLSPADSVPPAGSRPRWCTGTFRGVVQELQMPVCSPPRLCPAFVILVRTVGRFTFHVQPVPRRNRT